MKQKTIRFGDYWLKGYKHCGELRIDGGMNAFEDKPERQLFSMLASSAEHLDKIMSFGLGLALMSTELRRDKPKKRCRKKA